MSKKEKIALVAHDDPILRKTAKKIEVIDAAQRARAQAMIELTQKSDGLGLAAPQIGVSERLIVVRLPNRKNDKNFDSFFPMWNPEITWLSNERNLGEEGCLSLPGIFGKVIRPSAIHVNFLDARGKKCELKLHDLAARIILHEVDHLEGILFIDRAENDTIETAQVF